MFYTTLSTVVSLVSLVGSAGIALATEILSGTVAVVVLLLALCSDSVIRCRSALRSHFVLRSAQLLARDLSALRRNSLAICLTARRSAHYFPQSLSSLIRWCLAACSSGIRICFSLFGSVFHLD